MVQVPVGKGWLSYPGGEGNPCRGRDDWTHLEECV